MNRKNEFRRLFRESFTVDPRWAEWFMDDVYTDEEALVLEVDGKAVSTMLLSSYPFAFHGKELSAAYISCVATARSERGKGLMHRLFPRALNEAAERGFAIATLIPATHRLYFFYDLFGFSTVFYSDEMRYTALHTFPVDGDFEETTPSYTTFRRLEDCRPCCIRHDERRFRQILEDYRLSDGYVVEVQDSSGAAAMAFVQTGAEAKVTDLLADNDAAADAVLAAVRSHVSEKPVIVMGIPADSPVEFASGPVTEKSRDLSLTSHAMARIINAESVLAALATAYPKIDQVVRVTDPLIASNNSIFTVRDGECTRTPATLRRPTLDVTIDVLTRIVFSAPEVGKIFNISTHRPVMTLMLE